MNYYTTCDCPDLTAGKEIAAPGHDPKRLHVFKSRRPYPFLVPRANFSEVTMASTPADNHTMSR